MVVANVYIFFLTGACISVKEKVEEIQNKTKQKEILQWQQWKGKSNAVQNLVIREKQRFQ